MSTWIAGLDALAAGWAPAVWRASWQGAIAVALVWVVCRVVPRMSAPVRCWLWRLVCLKLLISLLWANPVAELPVLPALPREPVETEMNGPLAAQAEEEVNETPPAPAEAEVNAMHAVPVAVSLPASVSSVSSLPAPASPAPLALPSAPSLLLLAWVLGVAWCVLRTGREWALVRCLCRASRAVDAPLILNISRELCDRLRVRRPPDLIRSEAIESPILIGTLRPMILLPDRLLSEASGGQLQLMLTHELIHLKQRDLWWGWLSLSAHTLFFFHPLVWLASREWHLAQEVACDERAVKATGAAPGAYGEMLLCVASARYSGPCCAPATVGVMESCRTLTSRLVAIKHIVSISRKSLAASASLVLLFATAGIVPWRLVHSTATAQEAALEPAVLGSVVQDMVDQLASEDADARLLGAYGLWTLADERGANVELSPTTPALVEALEDEDREVRWNAALALVSVGRHSAEPAETLPPRRPS